MRFFHSGAELSPPIVNSKEFGTAILMPPRHWRKGPQGDPEKTYAPCKPGSAVFSYDGHFYIVPPGGWVDIPEPCDVEAVKAVCGAMVPETEWSGPLPELVKQPAKAQPAPEPAPVKEEPASSSLLRESAFEDFAPRKKK